ncbi:MAG TPA: ABC transporter permease [Acidimicrobiales bacterium]|nr:ABC transporter permease [Acidimicrobiales bacterium]
MTATVEPHVLGHHRGGLAEAVPHALVLSRRAVLGLWRQPNIWISGSLFPLLIAAVQSSAFSRTIGLPGFPEVDSFLQFVLPATVIQVVLFGAITGGTELALDLENGFFDRLIAAPTSRVAILFGRLAGVSVLAAAQTLLYVAIFAAFGATVRGGVGGIAVLMVLSIVLAIGIGGLACAIGLRTGSAEAVGNSFPLVFILLFISSAFFPVELMGGWYRWVAERNPLTWMIDGARHQVVVGFDLAEAATALAVAGGLVVVSFWLALRQLRRRLADVS